MIKVGVVGYGTIGKRVADAVLLEDDMDLIGITANTYNYKIESAIKKGIYVFAIGNIKRLLDEVDIIVDCTPKGVGAKNKELYVKARVKAVFQGGEKPDVGKSFVSQCNYDDAIDADFIRVVSCNTTGLCRTLHAVDQKYGIESVHATIVRRAADPWDIYHGPINAIVPTLELPSHHGPDVKTVLPDLEIFTTSMTVPTTVMHMHSITADLKKETSVDDVLKLFRDTKRVRIVRNTAGIRSTAEIVEYAKDLGHSRGDMPDICIWEETVGISKNKLFYLQAVHQESNVIPENIDAIRAAMGRVNDETGL